MDLTGKRALDIGCGFGMMSLTMSLLGAKEVRGVDIFDGMIDTTHAFLPETTGGDKVTTEIAHAFELPFEDNSFDFILTFEALSHFLHTDRCLQEAMRVLKPGGTYVIADDNNGANPKVVAAAAEIWSQFENGPATDDIHGHRVKEPYVDKRKRILKDFDLNLTDQQIQDLALNTAYYEMDDIRKVAEAFQADGSMPNSQFSTDRCPVNPDRGEFIENLLNPFELAGKLEKLSGQSSITAYFGGDGRGGVVKVANDLLNVVLPTSLATKYSPGFRLRTTKV